MAFWQHAAAQWNTRRFKRRDVNKSLEQIKTDKIASALKVTIVFISVGSSSSISSSVSSLRLMPCIVHCTERCISCSLAARGIRPTLRAGVEVCRTVNTSLQLSSLDEAAELWARFMSRFLHSSNAAR
jgi:hypothetical protein